MDEMSQLLQQARADLAAAGKSEFSLHDKFENMTELFKKIQLLREEMNFAKKEAAEQAAKPYLELIEEIQTEYALFIKLSS